MLEFANVESLNGLWQFAFFQNEEPANDVILNTPLSEYEAVPGCFDTKLRFGEHGTGVYRRTFSGKGWLQIRFEGLGLRGKVWADQVFLGSLDAPFSPYEFLFNAGDTEREIVLTVAVSNMLDESDGSLFHEFYDFYNFGGIYRGVTLRRLASPTGNGIANIAVTPLEASAGRFRVQVDFLQATETTLSLSLDNSPLASMEVSGKSAVWEGAVAGLTPWTAENPVLLRSAAESRTVGSRHLRQWITPRSL